VLCHPIEIELKSHDPLEGRGRTGVREKMNAEEEGERIAPPSNNGSTGSDVSA